jgi:hypothetical protein
MLAEVLRARPNVEAYSSTCRQQSQSGEVFEPPVWPIV